ncbi:fluoride efflux transporter CrcB [Hydromonas duriensis]|uniref:Fluoride-specific ion channel FluC n=1 Tax=Hydromonas duriensis TaxID=1527608 RepID=A0A4R6Y826_9BURK|nr:fluoride efflux transporter CrcB [Hydromonas duriensis]TDR31527.1 protein CrcB [Hydromonas duriensis]
MMNNWSSILLVAFGGAIGSVSRYKLSGFITQHYIQNAFPVGTFIVNLLGCMMIGILAGLGERYQWLTSDLRLLLITGVLGGFTTFSAFSLETFMLLRRGEWLLATGYVGLSVVLGMLLLWMGFICANQLFR